MEFTKYSEARQRLDQNGGLGELNWTLLRIEGKDATAFLHNMTTNHIRGLELNQFCELFVTDVRGKTLAHGWMVKEGDQSYLFVGGPGQVAALTSHWDRYLITEEVTFTDLAGQTRVFAVRGLTTNGDVAGGDVAGGDVAGGEETIENDQSVTDCVLLGKPVRIIPLPAFGASSSIALATSAVAELLLSSAAEQGCVTDTVDIWESLRVEAGVPLYGLDITPDNLPQEVGRDSSAIHFAKGCYLGQETIARIDAMGHVNWNLVVAKVTGELAPHSPLESNGKIAAKVGTIAWSPTLQTNLALAYVRRENAAVGSTIVAEAATLEVVSAPVESAG
jgi:folate-binding protein YgfZ